LLQATAIVALGSVAVAALTVAVLRPRPRQIELPGVVRLPSRASADSLPQSSAPLPRVEVAHLFHIGGPTVVAFLPDSVAGAQLLTPELAKLRGEFLAALPELASTARAAHFTFAVRPAAGLVLWAHRGGRIWNGTPGGVPIGVLVAAPNYPAVRLAGIPSAAALADALARYAALIGMPEAAPHGS
jgi:hypothetical protein